MTSTTTPSVGQTWADCDSRNEGRTLRITAIDGEKAICEILTNDTRTQEMLDSPTRPSWVDPAQSDRRGKVTRVALKRLRPTSTGYRLVTDAPGS